MDGANNLSRFLTSLTLGWGAEADFQSFADEYPNNVFLEELPKVPIWFELKRYLKGEAFFSPHVTLPSLGFFMDNLNFSTASYNETFLALSVTYTCMPSFR